MDSGTTALATDPSVFHVSQRDAAIIRHVAQDRTHGDIGGGFSGQFQTQGDVVLLIDARSTRLTSQFRGAGFDWIGPPFGEAVDPFAIRGRWWSCRVEVKIFKLLEEHAGDAHDARGTF